MLDSWNKCQCWTELPAWWPGYCGCTCRCCELSSCFLSGNRLGVFPVSHLQIAGGMPLFTTLRKDYIGRMPLFTTHVSSFLGGSKNVAEPPNTWLTQDRDAGKPARLNESNAIPLNAGTSLPKIKKGHSDITNMKNLKIFRKAWWSANAFNATVRLTKNRFLAIPQIAIMRTKKFWFVCQIWFWKNLILFVNFSVPRR